MYWLPLQVLKVTCARARACISSEHGAANEPAGQSGHSKFAFYLCPLFFGPVRAYVRMCVRVRIYIIFMQKFPCQLITCSVDFLIPLSYRIPG